MAKGTDQKEKTTAINWLDDATNIEFGITYLGIIGAETITWKMRILQTDEEKALRQKHFAQADEKQAASRHAYNVEMISMLATDPPAGLPGINEALAEIGETDNALQKAIYGILIKPSPARIKLADDTLNYYTTVNQPAEFYAGFKS